MDILLFLERVTPELNALQYTQRMVELGEVVRTPGALQNAINTLVFLYKYGGECFGVVVLVEERVDWRHVK